MNKIFASQNSDNKLSRYGVCIAATALALISPSLQANLLTNGSFEQNAFFVERAGFPRLDDSNGSAPTGWTRDSGTLAEYMVRTPLFSGVTIYNTADGDYIIGPHDGEWWEQSFSTVPGTEYLLTYSSAYGSVWWSTFYYRPATAPGSVTVTGNSVLFSGDLIGTAPAPTGTTLLDSPFVWSEHSATFTADSSRTTLRFAGSSIANGGYVFVDNASIVVRTPTGVPEPGSALLLAAGLIGLTAFRRVGVRE